MPTAAKQKKVKKELEWGRCCFSPSKMNEKFKEELGRLNWVENRITMYTTDDDELLKNLIDKNSDRQKRDN